MAPDFIKVQLSWSNALSVVFAFLFSIAISLVSALLAVYWFKKSYSVEQSRNENQALTAFYTAKILGVFSNVWSLWQAAGVAQQMQLNRVTLNLK